MTKRFFDITLSFIALLALSPVLLITVFLVYKHVGHPVLFRQPRPGLNGKVFNLLKFRSMTDAIDSDGHSLPDSERLTPFGQKLRATSIDELPSLLNVLTGDMSLVGPRPLLVEYLKLYSKEQQRRHNVRPGITGWAQVNGRNAISWNEKFSYDLWYVDNSSLMLDIKILLLTVKKVFLKSDISSEDEVTCSKFKGNK